VSKLPAYFIVTGLERSSRLRLLTVLIVIMSVWLVASCPLFRTVSCRAAVRQPDEYASQARTVARALFAFFAE
jgi:hypothetical protein